MKRINAKGKFHAIYMAADKLFQAGSDWFGKFYA